MRNWRHKSQDQEQWTTSLEVAKVHQEEEGEHKFVSKLQKAFVFRVENKRFVNNFNSLY